MSAPEALMFDLTLPLRVVSVMNTCEHWAERARRAKSHRRTTALVVGARQPPECIERLKSGGKLRVSLVRVGRGRLDGDNLQAALKAVRDGVADALRIDDADPRLTWEYGQRIGKQAVEIRIGGIE